MPLLYHYFGSREGLLEAAMLRASDQAGSYGAQAAQGAATARDELVARLVGELQETDEVRTNSAAWGELRWSAAFEDKLKPVVQRLTLEWVEEIAELVQRVLVEEGDPGRAGARGRRTPRCPGRGAVGPLAHRSGGAVPPAGPAARGHRHRSAPTGRAAG